MVAPRAAALATLSLLSLAPRRAEAAWYDEIVDTLQLPAGFSASVYAEVPAARSLSYNPATGTVFVGAYDFSGIQGRDAQLAVYALRDLDGNDDALGPSEALPVTQKIANPNGVSFLNGDLFVAHAENEAANLNVLTAGQSRPQCCAHPEQGRLRRDSNSALVDGRKP